METRKYINMEVVNVHVPKGTGKERRKRPIAPEFSKRRKDVGRRMGNKKQAPVHVLNEAAGGKPTHARGPQTRVEILGRGSKRWDKIRNVGRRDGQGKTRVRKPRGRKRKNRRKQPYPLRTRRRPHPREAQSLSTGE